MKKNFLTLLAVLIGIGVQAQTGSETNQVNSQSDEIKTLFSNTGGIGWWVSPDFEWTQFEGDDVFLGGLSGGIIINHSFSLGLGGYGILNSQNLRYSGINDTADVYLYGGYDRVSRVQFSCYASDFPDRSGHRRRYDRDHRSILDTGGIPCQ